MQSSTQQVPEEYLNAQRAAIEAVQIGRATLEATARQGEQLSHAEKTANETQYALDKSNRLLKGMTWSGWVSNMFSKDVDTIPSTIDNERQILYQREEMSNAAQPTAQTIQNYQANLMIYDCCDTREQKKTCQMVCDNMYQVALEELAKLEQVLSDAQTQILKHQFRKDLAFLRHRQDQIQQIKHCSESGDDSLSKNNRLFAKGRSDGSQIQTHQEHHLDILATNLGELNTMAHSLNEMMGQHQKIMENLDSKSDNMYETSKTVTRRADRLLQDKSWSAAKKTFDCYVNIRQLSNGRYLTEIHGTLLFLDKPSLFATFAVWRRDGGMIGLCNKTSSKWIGQTLFGGLACTSSKFGQREEWQVDDNWNETRLLCASAGWGNGGYLLVKENQAQIGAGGVEGKAKAEVLYFTPLF